MSSFLDYEGLKRLVNYINNKINSSAGALGVRSFKGRFGNVVPQEGDYTADMVGAVPTSRTINGKPLTEDITIEVEAPVNDGVISFNSRKGAVTPQSGDYTASMVGAVPTYRTINGKPLSSNITIGLSDVAIGGRNIELVTYTGTGEYGSTSKACSLTFSFAPKMIIWFLRGKVTPNTSGSTVHNVFFIPSEDSCSNGYCVTDHLTTEYQNRLGPNSSYAKISNDGKTLYWYFISGTVDSQYNNKDYVYYVVAFG